VRAEALVSKSEGKLSMQWKTHWAETKRHFTDWWQGEGLVLNGGSFPAERPHEETEAPSEPPGLPDAGPYRYAGQTPELQARVNHHQLARRDYPADALPLANVDIGPGSLALLIGSEPEFTNRTIWFRPTMQNDTDPERLPPLLFDAENPWWRAHEQAARACAEMGRGKYAVGCQDLVENIDILAALRETQNLLMDMIERPEWVERKVWEINRVWIEAYSRLYDIIKMDDGGAGWRAFELWAPGRMAKVQCDASAMFSPAMFERFVVPALTAQCDWLDYSIFHLDGHQCLCHLDHLLSIESLNAIEWTPDPKVPGGGSPQWYPMYRRILDAGKSVQAVGVRPNEVIPLLDAVGGKGMYISFGGADRDTVERLAEQVESYRGR
jgi:hypothetical protein